MCFIINIIMRYSYNRKFSGILFQKCSHACTTYMGKGGDVILGPHHKADYIYIYVVCQFISY